MSARLPKLWTRLFVPVLGLLCVIFGAATLARGSQMRSLLLGSQYNIARPWPTSGVQDIPNPLRGQYEDLLQPLFPQANSAQTVSGMARVI